MKVTVEEIIKTLLFHERDDVAERIKAHGIAPPDGYVLVSIDTFPNTQSLIAKIKTLPRYDYYALNDGGIGCEPNENGDNFDASELLGNIDKWLLSAVKEKDNEQ